MKDDYTINYDDIVDMGFDDGEPVLRVLVIKNGHDKLYVYVRLAQKALPEIKVRKGQWYSEDTYFPYTKGFIRAATAFMNN
jgi:hypothetical protein